MLISPDSAVTQQKNKQFAKNSDLGFNYLHISPDSAVTQQKDKQFAKNSFYRHKISKIKPKTSTIYLQIGTNNIKNVNRHLKLKPSWNLVPYDVLQAQ
jgi:hypothetical protein